MKKVLAYLLAMLLLTVGPAHSLAEALPKGSAVDADYISPVLFTFSDAGITFEGSASGCEIDGTELMIEAPGTYAVTGSCTEGAISVKKNVTGVVLILKDLSLTCSETAPLVCKGGSEVTLFATGDNALTDNESDTTLADYEGAAIKVKSAASLTLEGDGSLNVTSRYKNAIKGAATSAVTVNMNSGSGSLTVSAVNNGIAADGEVVVNSGSVSITAGNEGIKAEPDDGDAESKGAVSIAGGNITIDADSDGIQAANSVVITGGDIAVRADSDCIHSHGDLTISGGSFDLKTLNGYTSSFDSDSTSCKGIKASATDDETAESENTLTITGGDFTLNTADDAIHSDGYIVITGGTFDILTGDDGVHADNSLTLGADGGRDRDPAITIRSSYEGLESADVYIYSGRYWVRASDDGINAAGGSGQGSDVGGGDHFGPGGRPGGGSRMGASMTSGGDYSLNIYGGHVFVNADGDGLDSNGDINLTGGEIEVWGQSRGDNEPLDFDGTMTLKGATVFAAGNVGMGLGTVASSSQSYKSWSTSVSSGRVVTVNSGSNMLYNASAPKAVSYEFFSSPSASSSASLSSASGSVSCAYGNSWSHSWNSGSVSGGVRTYTCQTCGATEKETVLTSTSPATAKSAAIEPQEDDAGYAIAFNHEKASVMIYYTQDLTKADEQNVDAAVSRASDTGAPDSSGNGQLNFVIVPEEGYVVTGVTVEGSYKNLKDLSSDTGMANSYRITKITSELTVTVNTARLFCLPSALTALEDEAFAGIDAQYILLPEGLTNFGENAFGDSASEITFYVYKGSAGESYCQSNNYNYKYVS